MEQSSDEPESSRTETVEHTAHAEIFLRKDKFRKSLDKQSYKKLQRSSSVNYGSRNNISDLKRFFEKSDSDKSSSNADKRKVVIAEQTVSIPKKTIFSSADKELIASTRDNADSTKDSVNIAERGISTSEEEFWDAQTDSNIYLNVSVDPKHITESTKSKGEDEFWELNKKLASEGTAKKHEQHFWELKQNISSEESAVRKIDAEFWELRQNLSSEELAERKIEEAFSELTRNISLEGASKNNIEEEFWKLERNFTSKELTRTSTKEEFWEFKRDLSLEKLLKPTKKAASEGFADINTLSIEQEIHHSSAKSVESAEVINDITEVIDSQISDAPKLCLQEEEISDIDSHCIHYKVLTNHSTNSVITLEVNKEFGEKLQAVPRQSPEEITAATEHHFQESKKLQAATKNFSEEFQAAPSYSSEALENNCATEEYDNQSLSPEVNEAVISFSSKSLEGSDRLTEITQVDACHQSSKSFEDNKQLSKKPAKIEDNLSKPTEENISATSTYIADADLKNNTIVRNQPDIPVELQKPQPSIKDKVKPDIPIKPRRQAPTEQLSETKTITKLKNLVPWKSFNARKKDAEANLKNPEKPKVIPRTIGEEIEEVILRAKPEIAKRSNKLDPEICQGGLFSEANPEATDEAIKIPKYNPGSDSLSPTTDQEVNPQTTDEPAEVPLRAKPADPSEEVVFRPKQDTGIRSSLKPKADSDQSPKVGPEENSRSSIEAIASNIEKLQSSLKKSFFDDSPVTLRKTPKTEKKRVSFSPEVEQFPIPAPRKSLPIFTTKEPEAPVEVITVEIKTVRKELVTPVVLSDVNSNYLKRTKSKGKDSTKARSKGKSDSEKSASKSKKSSKSTKSANAAKTKDSPATVDKDFSAGVEESTVAEDFIGEDKKYLHSTYLCSESVDDLVSSGEFCEERRPGTDFCEESEKRSNNIQPEDSVKNLQEKSQDDLAPNTETIVEQAATKPEIELSDLEEFSASRETGDRRSNSLQRKAFFRPIERERESNNSKEKRNRRPNSLEREAFFNPLKITSPEVEQNKSLEEFSYNRDLQEERKRNSAPARKLPDPDIVSNSEEFKTRDLPDLDPLINSRPLTRVRDLPALLSNSRASKTVRDVPDSRPVSTARKAVRKLSDSELVVHPRTETYFKPTHQLNFGYKDIPAPQRKLRIELPRRNPTDKERSLRRYSDHVSRDGIEFADPEEIHIVSRASSEDSIERVGRIHKDLDQFFIMDDKKEKKRTNSFKKILRNFSRKDKKKPKKIENEVVEDNAQNESFNRNSSLRHTTDGQFRKNKELPEIPTQEVEKRYAQMHINRYNQVRANFEQTEVSKYSEDYVCMDNGTTKTTNPYNYINTSTVNKYMDTSSSSNTLDSENLAFRDSDNSSGSNLDKSANIKNLNAEKAEKQNSDGEKYFDTPPRAFDTYQNVQLVKPKANIPISSERPLPLPYQEVNEFSDGGYGTVFDRRMVNRIKQPSPEVRSQSSEGSLRSIGSRSPSLEGSKLRIPANREKIDLQPRIRSPIPTSEVSTDKIIATELLKSKKEKKDDKRSSPSHQRLEIEIDYPDNGVNRFTEICQEMEANPKGKPPISPQSKVLQNLEAAEWQRRQNSPSFELGKQRGVETSADWQRKQNSQLGLESADLQRRQREVQSSPSFELGRQRGSELGKQVSPEGPQRKGRDISSLEAGEWHRKQREVSQSPSLEVEWKRKASQSPTFNKNIEQEKQRSLRSPSLENEDFYRKQNILPEDYRRQPAFLENEEIYMRRQRIMQSPSLENQKPSENEELYITKPRMLQSPLENVDLQRKQRSLQSPSLDNEELYIRTQRGLQSPSPENTELLRKQRLLQSPSFENEELLRKQRMLQTSTPEISEEIYRRKQQSALLQSPNTQLTTNVLVHVDSHSPQNRSVTPVQDTRSRSTTPVTLRSPSSLSLQRTPPKHEIRQTVEAYCWKELKKLKEQEDIQMQIQLTNYGYLEDPIISHRSRSMTSSRNTRRSTSLPREVQRQRRLDEAGPRLEPLYGQRMQYNPNFVRNSPQRNTIGSTNSNQRPIFKRGSLTQNYSMEPQSIYNKKVGFHSPQNPENPQAWPTKNGYTQSPPQRRLEIKREASLEDEVFLPEKSASKEPSREEIFYLNLQRQRQMKEMETRKEPAYDFRPLPNEQIPRNQPIYGSRVQSRDPIYGSRVMPNISEEGMMYGAKVINDPIYGSKSNAQLQRKHSFSQRYDYPPGDVQGYGAKRSPHEIYAANPSTNHANEVAARQISTDGITRTDAGKGGTRINTNEGVRSNPNEIYATRSNPNDAYATRINPSETYATKNNTNEAYIARTHAYAPKTNGTRPNHNGLYNVRQSNENYGANPNQIYGSNMNEIYGARYNQTEMYGARPNSNELYGSRRSQNELYGTNDSYGARRNPNQISAVRSNNPNELYGSRPNPNELYGSRPNPQEIYGRLGPNQRITTVSNKVCDMYGKIHDGTKVTSPPPTAKSGVLLGQLQRNSNAPPLQHQSYNHLQNTNFVRGTRLTASVNDMNRYYPQDPRYHRQQHYEPPDRPLPPIPSESKMKLFARRNPPTAADAETNPYAMKGQNRIAGK